MALTLNDLRRRATRATHGEEFEGRPAHHPGGDVPPVDQGLAQLVDHVVASATGGLPSARVVERLFGSWTPGDFHQHSSAWSLASTSGDSPCASDQRANQR